MAAALKLRTADDVKRLFTALEDALVDSDDMSLTDVDQLALAGDAPSVDFTALGLTLLITLAAGYSAVQGYRRNSNSMGWGLTWGLLGYLFPVPAVVYSAVKAG